MIQEIVDRFIAKKEGLAARFAEKHPDSYEEIVRAVVETVTDDEEYGDLNPDPERIHSIDDGDYQGTLIFVIAARGYQPSTYWYVKVGYGSCSGCDTLEGIRSYDDEKPKPEQIEGYTTLALHVAQGLKRMGEDDV